MPHFRYFGNKVANNVAGLTWQPGQSQYVTDERAPEIRGLYDSWIEVKISLDPSGDTSGVTDRENLQAALSALAVTAAYGGEVNLSAGVFYLDREVVSSSAIGIKGAGGKLIGDAGTVNPIAPTTVRCLSPTENGIRVTAAGCTFRDFALINFAGSTPSAGAGIAGTLFNNCLVDGCTVLGFFNNLDLSGVFYQLSNNHFYDPVNWNVYQHSLSVPYNDHCDCGIIDNVFAGWSKSYYGEAHFRWEGGGGLRIIGNKFNIGSQPGNASAGKVKRALDLKVADGVITSSVIVKGNSMSVWTDAVATIDIGQLGPSNTGKLLNLIIVGNELSLGNKGIVIGQANTGSTEYIGNLKISDNILTYFEGVPITLGNCRKGHIGTNLFAGNVVGPLILLDTNSYGPRAVTVDRQAFGEQDGIDLIRDNRVFQQGTYSESGGVTYDYQRGCYISANAVWQTQFILTIPNGSSIELEYVLTGQNANAGHNSGNNLGVSMVRRRTFTTDTVGAVTAATVGTDVSNGGGAANVAIQFVLAANTITVQVQTTDGTQLALYAAGRLKVNGRLTVLHQGA